MKNFHKVTFSFCVLFLLPMLILIASEAKQGGNPVKMPSSNVPSQSMSINIIGGKQGAEIERDIFILVKDLMLLGHRVHYQDIKLENRLAKADINIFLDYADPSFYHLARKNYLIPNPEWCDLSAKQLSEFDLILCKTKDAERIFKPLNAHTLYMGFTSVNQFDEKTSKNYQLFLHSGISNNRRNIDIVFQTWLNNQRFPLLLLIKHQKKLIVPLAPNIKIIIEHLPPSSIKICQNNSGFHLYPLETEGFSHDMMEALSCGAVVITTDAPPMNELVLDKRCLVGYNRTTPLYFASTYSIDPVKFDKIVSDLLKLPEDQLKNIGKQNRELYLEKDRLFKQRLAEIFRSDFYPKSL